MWSKYEIIYIWTPVVYESEEWSSQLIFQFKQLERRSLKRSGLRRDSNPWPPRYRYLIYTSHHFTPHGRYELNRLASLPMCGFLAQLVEHRTGIAEVTGSNPVEALIFFRLSSFQLLTILHFQIILSCCSFNSFGLRFRSLTLCEQTKRLRTADHNSFVSATRTSSKPKMSIC